MKNKSRADSFKFEAAGIPNIHRSTACSSNKWKRLRRPYKDGIRFSEKDKATV
ncbi:hypothetical protein [Paenibacillus sp. S150]|uniref:hypothetical protein n=1 Tax=Paenibacillus sp. S150 TaxID=2749826 RepID=UPI001C5962CC|nr:hypothetical protein [Paenibacillus sp. S150]MBW4084273.1 hypothetical protein [Paenibacillus sp. S150]